VTVRRRRLSRSGQTGWRPRTCRRPTRRSGRPTMPNGPASAVAP